MKRILICSKPLNMLKLKNVFKRRKEQDQAKTKYLKYRERSDKNIGEEDKLRVASSDKEALTERAKVFLY